MNAPALQELRRKLAADEPTYGLWITLESASITEMAVALGLDWVVIDAEHGHLDWREILDHLRAAVRSRTVALVRLAELNAGLIKRALDIGADGVVIPWIETAEELARAVAYAHYPPPGRRGIGGERATCWGRCLPQHVAEAEANVLVVPIIESVRAAENIEQICQVPGVELVQLGPADFSSTAGFPGQWEGPGVAQQLLAIKDTVRRHGKHCGVVATDADDLLSRRAQGFRFLGVGLDAGLLVRSISAVVAAVGRIPSIKPGFPVSVAEQREAAEEGVGSRTMGHAPAATPPMRAAAPAASGSAPVGAGLAETTITAEAGASPAVSSPAVGGSSVVAGSLAVAHSLPAVGGTPVVGTRDDATRLPGGHSAGGTDVPVVVATTARAARLELEPGVVFRPLVGGFNSQANMTVGWVKFAPQKGLPCHEHLFPELMVVTAGELLLQVEDRAYQLNAGDALCVPPHTPHRASNRSAHRPATIYIAMGSAEPTRTLVADRYVRRMMPSSALGEPGGEQIVRAVLPPAGARAVQAAFASDLTLGSELTVRQERDIPLASWFSRPALGSMGMGAVVLAAGSRGTMQRRQGDVTVLAARGRCRCQVCGRQQRLAEGAALLVPAGYECALENDTAGETLLVWVTAPRHA